jgi:hypothetical protein
MLHGVLNHASIRLNCIMLRLTCNVLFNEVEVEVKLRPTVRRPVCPAARHPSGTRDQFLFLLEISFRQLRVCYFVVPSLTKGRVCNLLYNCFWALPGQSLLGRSPSELTAIFYCLFWDSPTWRARSPYLYLPGTGWPSDTPGQWASFCRLLRLAGLRWRHSNPRPHGCSFNVLQQAWLN